MSIVHVNQIKDKLGREFKGKIDLSDCGGADSENFFLSRSLAAYALQTIANVSTEVASKAITDGSNDNGLDAILFSKNNKQLFLIQSKWIHDGKGEPDNASVKKFIAGIKDIFNLEFDRFNNKVQEKRSEIDEALRDPETRYSAVLVHTGSSNMAEPSRRDLDDLKAEINDISDVFSVSVWNQATLYKSLTNSISGEPVNLEIALKHFGKIDNPIKAWYGHVNGLEVAQWWKDYESRLFNQNLRSHLGETDINSEIGSTIESDPEKFWYFNNGITIICKKIQKTMVGGSDREVGTFHCTDVSIVNGAQTVSSIGRSEQKNIRNLEKISVQTRLIEVSEDAFSQKITRTNNRQNEVKNRDFVRLDPQQTRIRDELAISGVEYRLMRSDNTADSETSFDLVMVTTALACASKDVKIVVQLKREIGKLWDDLDKGFYKALFNASVSGAFVLRAVQLQRQIDSAISELSQSLSPSAGRPYGIAVHGNRIIAAKVFNTLNETFFAISHRGEAEVAEEGSQIKKIVESTFGDLKMKVNAKYATAMLPTLFKNASKCADFI